jgi:hypothetical protein
MFDFVSLDWFYFFFGASYLFLVVMVYSYLRDLKRLEDKVDELEERIKK